MTAAADAALDEVRRLDGLLSNYKPASELSQINQQAADHPVRISPEVVPICSRRAWSTAARAKEPSTSRSESDESLGIL